MLSVVPGVVLIETDDAFERRSLASSLRRHGLTVVETARGDGVTRLSEIWAALRIVTDHLDLGRAAIRHDRYRGGHLLVDAAATRYDQQRLSKLRLVLVARPFDRAAVIEEIVEALRPEVLAGPAVGAALLEQLARQLLRVGADAMDLLEAVDIFVVDQALRRESGNVARAAARIGESEHYVRNRRWRPARSAVPAIVVVAVSIGRMEGRLSHKLRSLEHAMALVAAGDAKSISEAARKLGGDKYRRYLQRELPPEVLAALRR